MVISETKQKQMAISKLVNNFYRVNQIGNTSSIYEKVHNTYADLALKHCTFLQLLPNLNWIAFLGSVVPWQWISQAAETFQLIHSSAAFTHGQPRTSCQGLHTYNLRKHFTFTRQLMRCRQLLNEDLCALLPVGYTMCVLSGPHCLQKPFLRVSVKLWTS